MQEASNLGIAKGDVYLRRKEGVSSAIGFELNQMVLGVTLVLLIYKKNLINWLYFKKTNMYLLKFQRLHALDLISHEIKLELDLPKDLKKSTNLSMDQLNVSPEFRNIIFM